MPIKQRRLKVHFSMHTQNMDENLLTYIGRNMLNTQNKCMVGFYKLYSSMDYMANDVFTRVMNRPNYITSNVSITHVTYMALTRLLCADRIMNSDNAYNEKILLDKYVRIWDVFHVLYYQSRGGLIDIRGLVRIIVRLVVNKGLTVITPDDVRTLMSMHSLTPCEHVTDTKINAILQYISKARTPAFMAALNNYIKLTRQVVDDD